MAIKKEHFFQQFAQQALDERVSLFLGAGGSCDAGYPTWKSLFTPFAEALETPIDESTDYYHLAQYYANEYGSGELRKRINESVNKNRHKSRLLEELLKVGFSNIWTTNFDNALEMSYQQENILTNKIFQDADFSNIDIQKRVNIFKMNGDITNLDGIVATQSDYERYEDTHRVMLTFFKRELISSTFLFIGYSFTDHLVLDCLSEIRRYLGETATYHYAIMRAKPDDKYFEYFIKDLEKRYNIRVLLVEEYDEIPTVLAELNTRIRSKRVFISGAFSSQDMETENFSHMLSRDLSSKLLSKDYRIVNGIGRRFGTHLIGYANEYLAKEGIKNIDRHLIIKPFVGKGELSADNKRNAREKVISQCGAAIFVFGDRDIMSTNTRSGVIEEFEIACAQHKIIIPIAYPGMASEQIWIKVKNSITKFPYLEKVIDNLRSEETTDKLSDLIAHILDSTQDPM